MNPTKYLLAMIMGLALLFGGASLAQEAGDKALPESQKGDAPEVPAKRTYLQEQRREENLLKPYQPGRTSGMPQEYDARGSMSPRGGSSLDRTKPQPLPSPLDSLERRKGKRLRKEVAIPRAKPGEADSSSNLAASRNSSEGVYRVSYSGDEPNSYGLPFSWQVKVQDKNGLPITGAHLSLRMNMPRGGHAPVITGMAVRELGGGLYQISGIRCDRRGLWRAVLEVHGRGYGDTVTFNLMVP